MKLSDITNKLIRRNIGRYILFGASICFAVAMIGAYGILLFSKTITSVLMTDGSTYIISLGMYGITIAGVFAFLLYANGVYFQASTKEIGIYLSLGMQPKAVARMEDMRFYFCFLLGGFAGILLTVPVSFGEWKLLTLFLTYTGKAYTVGWKGLWIAVALWIFSCVLLRVKNHLQLSRMDVLQVLKADTTGEKVKMANPVIGMIGFVAIPIGIILFNVTVVIIELKNISTLFLAISLVGVYVVTAQITSVGRIVKRIYPIKYQKNLLFFNLVRQKGRQYTLALFVSTVLIALTVFSICFNASTFLESYFRVKEDPYDFAVFSKKDLNGPDEAKIREMAEDNGITVTDWHTLHLLMLGRQYQYQDDNMNEWASDFAISVSEFNALSGEKLSLPDDSYAYFQDSEDAMFLTCSEEEGLFYNPTTKEVFILHKEKLLTRENVLNNSAQIDSLLIISDKTFDELSQSMGDAYKLDYYLFNGTGLHNSAAFQEELLKNIVKSCGGKMVMNVDQTAVKDKLTDYQEEALEYEGNELTAARFWLLYPYAKQTQNDIQMEYGAVYLLLVFFIALISFVSATMIIALKVAGTISQDIGNYRKAMYLGQKEENLKRLIRKQMMLVFFYPSICGCITASFMINRFLSVTSIQHYHEVTAVSIGLSVIVFLIQVFIFEIVRKKLVNSVTKKVYENF